MIEGWVSKNFEDCIERIKYTQKIPRKEFLVEGDWPIVSQEAEFINGYWSNEADVLKLKKPLVVFGDHTKTLKFVDFDFVLGADGVKLLQPTDDIDPKYFYYFLQANPVKALGYARHYRLLKEIEVRFPSDLREQRKIVSILNKAFEEIDAAIGLAEKNLANTVALFESHVNSVFAEGRTVWGEQPLEDLSELITKGSSPKWQGISYVEHPGILFVTSENVGVNEMIMDKIKYVDEAFNKKDKKSILKEGDVLTNIVGASIGRTAIFDQDVNANINQAVCLIRPQLQKLHNKFLCFLLNSPFFRTILHENEIDNARANLSLGFFRGLNIPLPKFEDQLEIVEQLQLLEGECKHLGDIYRSKISCLLALKQSILAKAFAGELTAQPDASLKEAVA